MLQSRPKEVAKELVVLHVFAVYDTKACGYLQPFFSVNRAVAMRDFGSAVNDEGTGFHRFAGDYKLYELGTWDPEKGRLNLVEPYEDLGFASDYLLPKGVK